MRIRGGGLLAGVVPVPSVPDTVLVSDSTKGVVWRVNTLTREYEVGVEDPKMQHPPWAPTPFGIGTIQLHRGHLYWCANYEATIYRVRLAADGQRAPGARRELVKTVRAIFLDGFTFGPRGGDTIWAATNADNRLVAVTPDGEATVVAGAPDEMTLAGAVAPAFGRRGDTDTLYVVTSGALVVPVNGTMTEGGKLVAVDTRVWAGG